MDNLEFTVSHFMVNGDSMIYMEETEKEYSYYISLPGAKRKDIDIDLLIEEDFITIFVKLKKDTIFVNKNSFRIVKSLASIKYSHDEDMKFLLDKGVLEIKVKKA